MDHKVETEADKCFHGKLTPHPPPSQMSLNDQSSKMVQIFKLNHLWPIWTDQSDAVRTRH